MRNHDAENDNYKQQQLDRNFTNQFNEKNMMKHECV